MKTWHGPDLDLGNVMLRERSQVHKTAYRRMPLM